MDTLDVNRQCCPFKDTPHPSSNIRTALTWATRGKECEIDKRTCRGAQWRKEEREQSWGGAVRERYVVASDRRKRRPVFCKASCVLQGTESMTKDH